MFRDGIWQPFFCLNAKHNNVMNKPKQARRVSSKRIRAIFSEIADEICNAHERVTLAMSGNTIEFHLEGGSINITINEPKGGEQ